MDQIASENLRAKLLKLIDGIGPSGVTYAYHLNQYVHVEPIVDWLLSHGFKGQIFVEWLKDKHKNSLLELVKFVVAQINRAPKKPILVGRDYHAAGKSRR